jgi:hypothetical protein
MDEIELRQLRRSHCQLIARRAIETSAVFAASSTAFIASESSTACRNATLLLNAHRRPDCH